MTRVLAAVAIVSLTAVASLAQSTTTSTQTKKFEVLTVDGNRLVVRLPEGTRELTVADDFRFNIDGQQMAARELKPGMKGTATITTQTTVTPVSVTEVKNGTVMQASGASIIVRTDQGIKMFSQGELDKRGVKIVKDGQPAEISDFHEGDKLTAVIVTSKPPRVMTQQQVNATLAKAAPAGAAGASAGAGSSASAGKPASAAANQSARQTAAGTGGTPAGGSGSGSQAEGTAGKKLPKTASSWPMLFLASILSLGAGIALTLRRRSLQ
jgi:hypothetical protein